MVSDKYYLTIKQREIELLHKELAKERELTKFQEKELNKFCKSEMALKFNKQTERIMKYKHDLAKERELVANRDAALEIAITSAMELKDELAKEREKVKQLQTYLRAYTDGYGFEDIEEENDIERLLKTWSK